MTIAVVSDWPDLSDGRGGACFSGKTSGIVWPMMKTFGNLDRHQIGVVTSLTPVESDEEIEFTDDDLKILGAKTMESLHRSHVNRAVVFGATACKALIPQFSKMEINNGMSYYVEGIRMVPSWHPRSALRTADEGKDPMAWIGAGLSGIQFPRYPCRLMLKNPVVGFPKDADQTPMAIDTEGTMDNPICLTWARGGERGYVAKENVTQFWAEYVERVQPSPTLVFHNAPWDWAVLEAMGVKNPHTYYFEDTMEMAYLRQVEPQGLKSLGERHFGVHMNSWEDVVLPYYYEIVTNMRDGIVEAGTKIITHSPKTGKEFKKPKIERTEEAKALFRLSDPDKIAAKLGFEPPSLDHVPFDEVLEYATLDAAVTLSLWALWGMNK